MGSEPVTGRYGPVRITGTYGPINCTSVPPKIPNEFNIFFTKADTAASIIFLCMVTKMRKKYFADGGIFDRMTFVLFRQCATVRQPQQVSYMTYQMIWQQFTRQMVKKLTCLMGGKGSTLTNELRWRRCNQCVPTTPMQYISGHGPRVFNSRNCHTSVRNVCQGNTFEPPFYFSISGKHDKMILLIVSLAFLNTDYTQKTRIFHLLIPPFECYMSSLFLQKLIWGCHLVTISKLSFRPTPTKICRAPGPIICAPGLGNLDTPEHGTSVKSVSFKGVWGGEGSR